MSIDDPELISPDGRPVLTWREDYPYTERMTRAEYEEVKRALQIELLKLQVWIKDSSVSPRPHNSTHRTKTTSTH